jgi:SAM-dependent methyltransferase
VEGERLPGFSALVLDDPFGHERPEVTGHLPEGIQRLLDVGCGSGAASAALKRRLPALHVTGIEKDPGAAELARARLDRVLEGEAADQMGRLAAGPERFDAFLLADVLEHLEDPIALLTLARRTAAAGATLVASVPNVGHLSVVRDLLLGRFDPLPSGLLDVGHLRWFTRRFLEEALAEAGWSVERIEGLPGAAPPEGEDLLSRLADWPELDRASLTTYQWVAVARPAAEGRGL